jgi:hypothetical protein
VGDGDHSTRSTETSRLATSLFASKLPQAWSFLVPKASTDLECSISQSFHKLRVFHRIKASCGNLCSSQCEALSRRLSNRLSSRQ